MDLSVQIFFVDYNGVDHLYNSSFTNVFDAREEADIVLENNPQYLRYYIPEEREIDDAIDEAFERKMQDQWEEEYGY